MLEYKHHGIYALIFSLSKNNVLLVNKSRGPYNGMLDLPGGSPEHGELPQDTLIREVTEETGMQLSKYKELGNFETRFHFQENQKKSILVHTGTIFLGTIKDEDVDTTFKSSDTNGCVWVEIENIKKLRATPPVSEAMRMHLAYKQTF